MPPSTTSSLLQTADSLARVCVERRIFVGDDREVFVKDWLEPFDADYRQGRVEGYVLDLTGGRLWAALDLSDISDAAYRDIALRSVRPDDVRASAAFLRLTRTCDPVTAVNTLTCSFAPAEWPKLAAACRAFSRNYGSVFESDEVAFKTSHDVVQEWSDQSRSNDDVSWEFFPTNSHSRIDAIAEEDRHVFHCVLTNGSEKNHSQRSDGDMHLAAGILKVQVNDDETLGLAQELAGSPWPDQLDRNNAIVFLTCIELALNHRHKARDAQRIQKLRRRVFSLSTIARV